MGRKGIILICVLLFFLLAASGCGSKPAAQLQTAGLIPATDSQFLWKLDERVKAQGEGNIYRVVTGPGLQATSGVELAAGGAGRLEYCVEAAAGTDIVAAMRVQFLSTQGTGRIKLSAFDKTGRELAAAGWVITGPLPSDRAVKWQDQRSSANYKGDWLTAEYYPHEILAAQLAGMPAGVVETYRLAVEVGEGQHVLLTRLQLASAPDKAIAIKPVKDSISAVLGEEMSVEADVTNRTGRIVDTVTVSLTEPYGYGLTVGNKDQKLTTLQPGETRRISWQVRAARPHTVNLDKPWQAEFAVNDKMTGVRISAKVADYRPGKIFYVMTEDLEAIDGAGYAAAWGNQNSWLEPAELTIQMVNKAEKLNSIAEQHGAKWTHYIAWPLVKAAQWAAGQSASGEWGKAVDAITHSVRSQAVKGHEYGLHLHMDYDPDLPGNVLSYNAVVDGFWANHLRHGWSHSVGNEGDFGDYASRTGLLFAYQRTLDELSAASSQGQLITARVGSFDFGAGPVSEAISTRAYRKVGLWASSDADGNEGGITAGPYGKEIYFAKPDDINSRAEELQHLGVVEFRPTPQKFINYDSQSATVMNSLADEGVIAFTEAGKVKPGIHAITGFTHAMFIMGQGDWTSTDQGQFAVIGQHLQYLRERYASQGMLTFGTAGELTRAWLDYYTPEPLALYGPRLSRHGLGISEYAIELLGADIPIDSSHPHKVTMKIPLYLRDSAYRAVILKNGQSIYATWGLPTPYNDIAFVVDDRQARYTLKVYHQDMLARVTRYVQAIRAKYSSK